MRIKGIVSNPIPLGYVFPLVVCEELGIRQPVTFLVDTGASITTLLGADATKLGIDCSKLEKSPTLSVGIGGTANCYLMPPTQLIFECEIDRDGETKPGHYTIRMETMHVMMPDPENQLEEGYVQRLPSLLGIDVLHLFKIYQHNGEVILEQ